MVRDPAEINPPYFVALDVDDAAEALSLADEVREFVGGFKLGPRLVYKYGAELVREMSQRAPVFVDNKYYDIPNTMLASLRATFEAGASFATIHAGCGPEALTAIAELEAELSKERPFRVLAVTVLTSFSEANRPVHWSSQAIPDQVAALANQAMNAGLSGLVCSPYEAAELRKSHPEAYLVTPGIRWSETPGDDQKRTMGPRQALQQGASALVIGRPIVKAMSPKSAAQKVYESLR